MSSEHLKLDGDSPESLSRARSFELYSYSLWPTSAQVIFHFPARRRPLTLSLFISGCKLISLR